MSQIYEGISLLGNGGWVTTTSAAKSGGTKRTKPTEPQTGESYLPSDDEEDEHDVEGKKVKTTGVDSFMVMRRWVERQQIVFAPCAKAELISNEEAETSSRVVRSLDELVKSLDKAIEAVDAWICGRGGPTYQRRRAQPRKTAAVAPMKKVSDEEVQAQGKLESGDFAAPPRPTPPLLTPQGSHQFQTQEYSNLNWLSTINAADYASIHDHNYSISPNSPNFRPHPKSPNIRPPPTSTPTTTLIRAPPKFHHIRAPPKSARITTHTSPPRTTLNSPHRKFMGTIVVVEM